MENVHIETYYFTIVDKHNRRRSSWRKSKRNAGGRPKRKWRKLRLKKNKIILVSLFKNFFLSESFVYLLLYIIILVVTCYYYYVNCLLYSATTTKFILFVNEKAQRFNCCFDFFVA